MVMLLLLRRLIQVLILLPTVLKYLLASSATVLFQHLHLLKLLIRGR